MKMEYKEQEKDRMIETSAVVLSKVLIPLLGPALLFLSTHSLYLKI